METNSQDNKPDFWGAAVAYTDYAWLSKETSYKNTIDGFQAGCNYVWRIHVEALQSELSAIKEERDLLKAEVERLKNNLK